MLPSPSCRGAVARRLTVWTVLVIAAGLGGCDPETTPGTDGDTASAPAPTDRALLSAELLESIDRALAAVRADPEQGLAWLELGMVYDANGLDDLAVPSYVRASRLLPRDARPRCHHARVLARSGRTDAALDVLDEARALAPDHAPLHWRRGRWLLHEGRLDEAELAFDRAAALDASDLGGLLGQVRVALARGDAARAEALLRPLVERHPDLGEVHFLLGSALRELGKLDAAAEQLALWDGRSAPLFDPWEGEVARHLAGYQATMDQVVAWGLSGEAGQAIAPLEAMHHEAPDDSAVLEKLVAAYLDTGRLEDARAVVSASLQRDDGHYRTWFALALVEERADQLPAAREAARACLSRHATWPRAHELQARLLWKSGDLAGAAASLDDALRFGGPDRANLLKRARALALLERWPEALPVAEQAHELGTPTVETLALLAETRAETGDLTGAWTAFAEAAVLDREHAQVRRVLARLVQLDPDRAAVPERQG